MDEYSKIISEKHNENEENTEIDENGSKSPPDDFEVWKGVGTSNRGHVLGAGFTTDPAFVLTGYLDLMHGNLKQKTPRVLHNVICEILDGANIYLKHTSKHLLDVDRFHPRAQKFCNIRFPVLAGAIAKYILLSNASNRSNL
ncbi:hypothetical protein Tco_1566469, partial [Tanacetum coccineum]